MALRPGTQRLLREAASWGVVAVIGVAAFTHFDALRSGTANLLGIPPAARRTPQARCRPRPNSARWWRSRSGRNGHFNTEAEINGRPIEVMIDTGATMVALSYEDAERAGLYLNDSDFTGAVTTANGVARVAPVTLDQVSIGDITVHDVPAAVTEPGRLKTSLLGMSFLSRLSRFDMRSGRARVAGLETPPFNSLCAQPVESTLRSRRLHLRPIPGASQDLPMLPAPRADLKPNTADFERLPLVKPTGFREYDARWLFPQEINLMGVNAVGLGHRHALWPARREEAHRRRPRLPLLLGQREAGADGGADGRRHGGARHRPRGDADGLLRPVRPRRRRCRHGHRQPQRQRLDRHQDGASASVDVRARGDERS